MFPSTPKDLSSELEEDWVVSKMRQNRQVAGKVDRRHGMRKHRTHSVKMLHLNQDPSWHRIIISRADPDLHWHVSQDGVAVSGAQ